jgi:protein-S-isoprenylcysteine O-methyltransferase Ste14
MSLSTIWSVLFYGWFAGELFIGIKTRTRRSTGTVHDRGTLGLLWMTMIVAITAGIWLSETQPSNLPAGPIVCGSSWLKSAAILAMAAGLLIRWTAIVSLGKSFSSNVAIHTTQKVFKGGLYRWVRHPSYTGLLLCVLAVALHTRNWISMLIIFVPTSAALMWRMHVEEIALRNAFGHEYIQYSRNTKRLIPGIF